MPDAPADKAAPPTDSRKVFRRLFPSIVTPMFLAVIDQTIVVAALPAIGQSFGHADRLPWIVVSYLIASTIAAPVYGRMGDVLGRRRLLFFAMGVFILGSLACAFAPSVETLILARLVQGIGGGGLMTLSQALIGESIPPRERARYQGYLATVMVTGNTLGPVLGGYLTEYVGWRSIFLVNIPLGAIAMLLALRLQARPGSGQRGRFDYPGLGWLTLFVASTLVSLRQVQTPQPNWFFGGGLAVLAFLAVIMLLRREWRTPNALLPMPILSEPSVWRTDAMAACHGATLVSLLTFVPLYLRTVHGASAAEIGLLLVPMTIGIGVGSIATGRLVSFTGRTALFPSVGLPAAFVLLVAFAAYAGRMDAWQVSILLFLLAMSVGTVMAIVQVTVQSAAGPENLGAAAASVQLARSLGAGVGTALIGVVLFAALRHGHPQAAEAFFMMIEGDAAAVAADAPLAALRHEIAGAFSVAFAFTAVFIALGASLAWSLPLRRI